MIIEEEKENESLLNNNSNEENQNNEKLSLEGENKIEENSSNISNFVNDLTEEKEVKNADSLDGVYNSKASTAKTVDASSFLPLKKFDEKDDVISIIEGKREEYSKQYKTKNLVSKILNIVFVVLLILALVILILSNVKVGGNQIIPYAWVPITVISIAGAFAIALAVVLYIYNKKFQVKTHNFFIFYQNILASYSLSSLNTEDMKIAPENQLNDELLIQAHYFSTIYSISSRGLVVGKIDENDFTYGEIACTVPYKSKIEANSNPATMYDLTTSEELPYKPEVYKEEKEVKRKGMFTNQTPDQSFGVLGRMLALKNSVDSLKSVIVCFKGDENTTFMPDYVSNYKAYKDNRLKDNIILFLASDDAKVFFDDEGINLLNQIEIDETFTSGFISINSYGSKLVLNLSDQLMVLPIENKPDKKAFDSLKDTLNKMVSFVNYVSSK